MTTFGYAEMRDWAEQSDDPRVRSMWERLSNCRSKIAKWCQAAEYAELRTKNLAAENAALRAEVERLREERRWRTFPANLPDANGRYVCMWADGDMYIQRWNGSKWLGAFDHEITHWMPLP